MTKLAAILNSTWFFPVIMLYYGIFYILFGETYYMNEGMSMDGVVFSSFVSNFKASYFFDAYYVHRIVPSLIVGAFFKMFSIVGAFFNLPSITVTGPHIFVAFQILNLGCIILSCILLKKILVFLKVTLKIQLLAFTLFLVNFSILKLPFYLAVMTDTSAIALSLAMLFFHIKKNTIGLILCTIIACFTWQMLFYQGLILVALPFSALPYSQAKLPAKIILRILPALLAGVICYYLVFIEKVDTNVELVAKINKSVVGLSILGVSFLFFSFSTIFLNSHLLNIRLFFSRLKLVNILIAVGIVGVTYLIVLYLSPVPNKFYPLHNILNGTITSALIWPLHTLVSDIAFWGVVMILLLFFWADFCKLISQMGWGIVAALALNIFTFGIISETRCLANLLPWIVVFLAKALNKYSFSTLFYIVVTLMCIATSKVWLLLNPEKNVYSPMYLDKNGSMGFPDQKMWMHIGPWMSQEMYYLQGGFILFFITVLFFILYKIQINRTTKLRLIRRY